MDKQTKQRTQQLADKILDAAINDTNVGQRELDGWVALAIDDNLLEQVVQILEVDVSSEIIGEIHLSAIKHMEHRVIRVKGKPMASRLLVIPLLLAQDHDPLDEGSANKNSILPFPSSLADTIRLSGFFHSDARVCVLGTLLNHETITDISVHEWAFMHKTLAEMVDGKTKIGIKFQFENNAYVLDERMIFLRYVVVAVSCPLAREAEIFASDNAFTMESMLTQIAQNLSLQFTEFGNMVDVSCVTPNSPMAAMATAETVLAGKLTETIALCAEHKGAQLIAAEIEKVEENTLSVKMHLQADTQFDTEEFVLSLPIAANGSAEIMDTIIRNIAIYRPSISLH